MAIYTYDQFQKAAQQAGLWGQFSQADMSLAQQNPDAGMSILKYKQDYLNAKTDEERARANKGAETIRSSYGGYTGGGNGGSFHLDPLGPSSFQQSTAPSFNWDTPKPDYSSRYDETIQNMIKDMLERPEFSYDPESDVVWKSYQKAYGREGDRATQNALGAAAAASGGMPSSYATTAAAQAGNYYAAKAADKIPDLFDAAYNRYLNEFNMDASKIGIVQGQEQTDYNRYLDELGQWNTDRNFAYNQFTGDRTQWNADREFAYNQLLDEINSQTQQRQEALDFANMAAQYGDYNYLKDLGIDTSALAALNAAGGYSGGGSSSGSSSGGTSTGSTGSGAEGMPQQYIEIIRDNYGGMELRGEQWQEAVSAVMAALGVDQSTATTMMQNAGFSQYGAASGGNSAYNQIRNVVTKLHGEGISEQQIMAYLDKRYSQGDITAVQVEQIMAELNLGGYNMG